MEWLPRIPTIDAPGYLRLSYATSIERIDEGLRRLEHFFSRAEAAA